MQNEWISVKDRLPDEDGQYLCVYPDEEHSWIFHYAILEYANNLQNADYGNFQGIERNGFYEWGWVEEEREEMHYEIKTVTHWTPLPELPKGE